MAITLLKWAQDNLARASVSWRTVGNYGGTVKTDRSMNELLDDLCASDGDGVCDYDAGDVSRLHDSPTGRNLKFACADEILRWPVEGVI